MNLGTVAGPDTQVTTKSGKTKTLHTAGITATPDTTVPVNVGPQQMTAYDELLAMGVSSTDASEFKSMDAGTNVATVAKPATAFPSYPAGTCINPCTVGTYPMCISGSTDSGMLYVRGCDTEVRVKGYGSQTWWMTDRHLSAGTMHDGSSFNPDELTGLRFNIHYGSGANIYTVNPANTAPTGSCYQRTYSVMVQGLGTSETETVCPETFGMYYWSSWTYETKWDGQGSGPSNGSRSTAGVNGLYAYYRSGVSRIRSIGMYWWWA